MANGKALWISFRITEEDLFQYMRYHGHYIWNTTVWVAIAYCFIAAAILGALDGFSAVLWLLLSGLLAVAGGVGCHRSYLRRMARRLCRETAGATGEFLLEITPDGLFCSGELGEGTVKWPAYTRVFGTSEYIYLYRGPKRALIIPRRVFASPGEAEAFLQAAQEWHAAATAKPVR
jgi:YcxB-like protein